MAVRLSEAGEGLVASLQKAQAELEQIAKRLEEESVARCRDGVNPMALLSRINKLKRDLPALREDCQAVLHAKQALADGAKAALGANTARLAALQCRAGAADDPAGQGPAHESLEAAIAEHEARFCADAHQQQLGGGGGEALSREELNSAFVRSVVL